eukprot:m.42416 g.42416  ORF g.42416 m.42416 type:complete len:74 (-) comp10688_c0_seq1:80-301(-)
MVYSALLLVSGITVPTSTTLSLGVTVSTPSSVTPTCPRRGIATAQTNFCSRLGQFQWSRTPEVDRIVSEFMCV